MKFVGLLCCFTLLLPWKEIFYIFVFPRGVNRKNLEKYLKDNLILYIPTKFCECTHDDANFPIFKTWFESKPQSRFLQKIMSIWSSWRALLYLQSCYCMCFYHWQVFCSFIFCICYMFYNIQVRANTILSSIPSIFLFPSEHLGESLPCSSSAHFLTYLFL